MLPRSVLLLTFVTSSFDQSHGYSSSIGSSSSTTKNGPLRHQRHYRRGRTASRTQATPPTTELNAGLRDLVGPYDDEYTTAANISPYESPSIREDRNSLFNGAGINGIGGGGGGGGGSFGGSTRRNSPGFIGFRGDRNYPNYDVIIDSPPSRESRSFGASRSFGGASSTRSARSPTLRAAANSRIYDNFGDDYYNDDLPPGTTSLVRGGDPYERGLSSDFINTNGASNGRGRINGVGGGGIRYDDFNDLSGFGPAFRNGGRNGRGGTSAIPQVYRREFLDDYYDGRGSGRGGGGGLQQFDSLGTPVERYFEAWNRRNVPLALSCFDENVYYDDTQFSEPFEGKAKLADHLLYVADCLPDSFYFVVDELSVGRVQGGRGSGRIRRDRSSTPNFQLGRDRVALAVRRNYNAPSISIGALWHIENEFGPLPFARGSSFFKVDPNTNLIFEAYDFPEPAVKAGSTGLKLISVASKIVDEPKRWFPFVAWIVYVYVVHISNGIIPGKDIFHADPKTWREIQDLSFNFLFIAPITHLPSAAKLNPVLEGIFNGLLAWSFLFAGFLSDERSGTGPVRGKDPRYNEDLLRNQEQVLDNGVVLVPPVSITKKNLIALVPTIVGMQFLTSAFLLPYLFSRTSERYSSSSLGVRSPDGRFGPRRIRPLYKEELDRPALVLGESRGLAVLLASIGFFAIYWGCAGGQGDVGPPIWVSNKRMVDFMKLLSTDRVAASFVIDMWVYGIFQGWLIDDDWKRRGRSLEEEKFLRNVAKFVPFFGLASYLIFRPRYPSSGEIFDYDAFFRRGGSRSDRRGGYVDDDERRGGGGFGDGFGRRFRNRN